MEPKKTEMKKRKKKYEDPDKSWEEIFREDARMADKAEVIALAAIVLSAISIVISILKIIEKWR